LTDKQRQQVDLIQRNARRLSRVMSDLTEFRDINKVSRSFAPAEFGIRGLIDDVALALGSRLIESGQDLTYRVAGSPEVFADRGRLAQAIMHAVTHVSEQSPSETTITLAVRVSSSIFITITNSSGGDDDPDPAGDSIVPDLDPENGSGLGLLIASSIAAMHDGTLDVEYTVPSGVSITIVLPIHDPRDIGDPSGNPPSDEAQGSPRRRIRNRLFPDELYGETEQSPPEPTE
jgi:signal transduction histidine kinase